MKEVYNAGWLTKISNNFVQDTEKGIIFWPSSGNSGQILAKIYWIGESMTMIKVEKTTKDTVRLLSTFLV